MVVTERVLDRSPERRIARELLGIEIERQQDSCARWDVRLGSYSCYRGGRDFMNEGSTGLPAGKKLRHVAGTSSLPESRVTTRSETGYCSERERW